MGKFENMPASEMLKLLNGRQSAPTGGPPDEDEEGPNPWLRRIAVVTAVLAVAAFCVGYIGPWRALDALRKQFGREQPKIERKTVSPDAGRANVSAPEELPDMGAPPDMAAARGEVKVKGEKVAMGENKRIALTVSGGPNKATEEYVEFACELGIPLSFFLTGASVDNNELAVTELRNYGYEVYPGGQDPVSWSSLSNRKHKPLLDDVIYEEQYERSRDTLERILAFKYQPPIFRPHGGVNSLTKSQQEMLLSRGVWIIGWDVDPNWPKPVENTDPDTPSQVEQMEANIRKKLHDGAIIVLSTSTKEEVRRNTIEALRRVLDGYDGTNAEGSQVRRAGLKDSYRWVKLSELLGFPEQPAPPNPVRCPKSAIPDPAATPSEPTDEGSAEQPGEEAPETEAPPSDRIPLEAEIR